MIMDIGVDVGNFDVKTQHCTSPSGYTATSTKPELSHDHLGYNGKYYIPALDVRMEYIADKTRDDQALVLALFGIAKEIIYQIKTRIHKDSNNRGMKITTSMMQARIDQVTEITLGVGLPVGDYDSMATSLKEYYKEKMGNGITFTYDGFTFNLKARKVEVYPQDILPIITNEQSELAKRKRYVIVGIGGQTVDVTPIINNIPDVQRCYSDTEGIRVFCSKAIDALKRLKYSVNEGSIIDILRGEPADLLSEEALNAINETAQDHANQILKACSGRNISFDEYPVVFFGGGALLLRKFLEANPSLRRYEFIEDVNGNAKCYADFTRVH